MRLSRGRVESGRLQCPYHGWTFALDHVLLPSLSRH
jgi:phenylpropionate dioxygenase-like ring-hydroxylating dioxygenase large terminal subunit